MLRKAACSCAILALAYPVAAAQTQHFPPLQKSSSQQYPGCPDNRSLGEHVDAIDAGQPTDAGLRQRAAQQHVSVVLRYYDWDGAPLPGVDASGTRLSPHDKCIGDRTALNSQFEQPWKFGQTLPGKTITALERDAILNAGLRIGIVFQHCNNLPETFSDTARAAYDAARALSFAAALEQPKLTTIFFGADFDAGESDLPNLKRYFSTVGEAISKGDYKLGIYGNGLTCDAIQKERPDIPCWLSESIGFNHSMNRALDHHYDIEQCHTRMAWKGSGVPLDLDIFRAPSRIRWWGKGGTDN